MTAEDDDDSMKGRNKGFQVRRRPCFSQHHKDGKTEKNMSPSLSRLGVTLSWSERDCVVPGPEVLLEVSEKGLKPKVWRKMLGRTDYASQ